MSNIWMSIKHEKKSNWIPKIWKYRDFERVETQLTYLNVTKFQIHRLNSHLRDLNDNLVGSLNHTTETQRDEGLFSQTEEILVLICTICDWLSVCFDIAGIWWGILTSHKISHQFLYQECQILNTLTATQQFLKFTLLWKIFACSFNNFSFLCILYTSKFVFMDCLYNHLQRTW